MDVDALAEWLNEPLFQILITLVVLAFLIWLFFALVRVSRRVQRDSGRVNMSKQQKDAERAAVEKLTLAQKLMMESDENADKAQQLRDEVVHQDLPKFKVYISAKSPKSLLADVDTRIRRARLRQHRQQQADGS